MAKIYCLFVVIIVCKYLSFTSCLLMEPCSPLPVSTHSASTDNGLVPFSCDRLFFAIAQRYPDSPKQHIEFQLYTALFTNQKRMKRFQIAKHVNASFLFIHIHVYPSGFHLEPRPKVLRDHNKGCLPRGQTEGCLTCWK